MDAGKLYIPDTEKWIKFYQNQVKGYYESKNVKSGSGSDDGGGGRIISGRQKGRGGGWLGTQYRRSGSFLVPLGETTTTKANVKQPDPVNLVTPEASVVERAKSQLENAKQISSANQIPSSSVAKKTDNRKKVIGIRSKTKASDVAKSKPEQSKQKAAKRKKHSGGGVSGGGSKKKPRRYDDIFSR